MSGLMPCSDVYRKKYYWKWKYDPGKGTARQRKASNTDQRRTISETEQFQMPPMCILFEM